MMRSRIMRMSYVVFFMAGLFMVSPGRAQLLTTPDASPEAWVKQRIGISTVKIHYHRPAVKGRVVWGELVPYGMSDGVSFGSGNPFPWRAGANENTTITFSHDALINQKAIKAGTYGLHVLVQPEQWTFIFSKNSSSWGSFHYNPEEDALRVTVKPMEAPHQEWLQYSFSELSDTTALVVLRWEKLKAGFTVQFATDDLVLANITEELRGQAGFQWQAYTQAAFYALQHNVHLDKAMQWIEKSMQMNENATNRNLYGYLLFARNKSQEAMKVFKENVEKYPDEWNIHDSMGEAYAKTGDTKKAIKFYTKALEMAPDGQKPRITQILEKLKSK